jgi:hypothetical protein
VLFEYGAETLYTATIYLLYTSAEVIAECMYHGTLLLPLLPQRIKAL